MDKVKLMKIITVSAIIFIAVLAIALIINLVKLSNVNNKKAALEKELTEIQRKIEQNNSEIDYITTDEYIERFMAPSGLTGLWQVEKRGEAGKLSAEERKQLDIKYAKTFSFWLDIKIILKTVTAFIQKENV